MHDRDATIGVKSGIPMSAQAYCLCPRGSNSVRGISRGPKAEEVVVTVQNDGVVCYNADRRVSAVTMLPAEIKVIANLPLVSQQAYTARLAYSCRCVPGICYVDSLSASVVQELVNSWALGSQQLKFVTKAVFEPSTRNYYAVVQQSTASTNGNHSLLSWPATAASGSLEQLAHRHTLTGAVHSVHPIPAHLKHTHDEAEAVDSNIPVAVVYTDGRVAFGTSVPVAERAGGMRLLCSYADADTLAVICKFKGVSKYQLDLYGLQVTLTSLQPQHVRASALCWLFQLAELAGIPSAHCCMGCIFCTWSLW